MSVQCRYNVNKRDLLKIARKNNGFQRHCNAKPIFESHVRILVPQFRHILVAFAIEPRIGNFECDVVHHARNCTILPTMHHGLNLSLTFAALIFAALSPGCTTVRVVRADVWTPAVKPPRQWMDGNGAYTVPSPATNMMKKTVWVLFWGFRQENVFATDCYGNGLAEVRIQNNVGFALISFLTFGFVQPITVEWNCAKQQPSTMKDF